MREQRAWPVRYQVTIKSGLGQIRKLQVLTCITVAVFRSVTALQLSVVSWLAEVWLHGVTSFRSSLVTVARASRRVL